MIWYRWLVARLVIGSLLLVGVLGIPTLTFAATPPAIFAITPSQGPKNAETNITIVGNNFKPDSAVVIGGLRATNVRAAACSDIGGGRLNCGILYATAPARGVAGSTSVIVLNPNGQAAYLPGGFTYY